MDISKALEKEVCAPEKPKGDEGDLRIVTQYTELPFRRPNIGSSIWFNLNCIFSKSKAQRLVPSLQDPAMRRRRASGGVGGGGVLVTQSQLCNYVKLISSSPHFRVTIVRIASICVFRIQLVNPIIRKKYQSAYLHTFYLFSRIVIVCKCSHGWQFSKRNGFQIPSLQPSWWCFLFHSSPWSYSVFSQPQFHSKVGKCLFSIRVLHSFMVFLCHFKGPEEIKIKDTKSFAFYPSKDGYVPLCIERVQRFISQINCL